MDRRNLSMAFAVVLLITALCSSFVQGQSEDRAKVKKQIDALNQEIKKKEVLLLVPSEKAQKKYAEFLKQSDTGLIRLLPRREYDCKLTINGGGAYYSFIRKTHEYGYGSDISLDLTEVRQNQSLFQSQNTLWQEYGYDSNIQLREPIFSVGFAGANFGFLLNLGNTPIEEVTTETRGVKYMRDFIPPTKEPEARIQQRRVRGFDADGASYSSRLPARVGDTYVVRSVDYRSSDCLVVFRVVDQDFDGSLSIVWKMLKKFPAPDLALK